MHSYDRDWTLSISWSRQYSCANSLNISTQIFCVICISKGSQDKDILCYGTLNRSQDIDICVLVDIGQITGQITGQIAGYGG